MALSAADIYRQVAEVVARRLEVGDFHAWLIGASLSAPRVTRDGAVQSLIDALELDLAELDDEQIVVAWTRRLASREETLRFTVPPIATRSESISCASIQVADAPSSSGKTLAINWGLPARLVPETV